MTLRMFVVICVSAALIGCAEKNVETDVSRNHPANPDAPAAAPASQPNVLADDEAIAPASRAAEDHASHHDMSGHQEAAASSPMHEMHDMHAKSAAVPEDKETGHHHETHAAGSQEGVDKLVASYLALTDQLAADKAEGAAKQMSVLHMAAHDLTDSDNEKVAAIAERIAKAAHNKAEDIESMREALKDISPAVIELAQLMPPTTKVAPVIHEAYCPMVKASWLQTGEQVANPYYGSAMLKCGKLTGSIQPRGAQQQE